MHITPENQTGFTLIEILVAITIFSVGLLAIAGLQISAINFNRGSNDRTAGVAIAQDVLEQILSRKGDDPLITSAKAISAWNLDPAYDANGNITLPGSGTLRARYTVIRNPASPAPMDKISTITVQVIDQQGRTTTMTGFKRTY